MALKTAPDSLTPNSARVQTDAPGPLRAAHTPNFPALLRQLGASLLVTTYQAGKLVMVRDEGDHLNTHFRTFKAPMGLALADGGAKLAIGTTSQVWEFRDVPDVARRLRRKDEGGRMKDEESGAPSSDSSFILHPSSFHDACYLPRSSHVTGNVLIHEMAWGKRGEGRGARERERKMSCGL